MIRMSCTQPSIVSNILKNVKLEERRIRRRNIIVVTKIKITAIVYDTTRIHLKFVLKSRIWNTIARYRSKWYHYRSRFSFSELSSNCCHYETRRFCPSSRNVCNEKLRNFRLTNEGRLPHSNTTLRIDLSITTRFRHRAITAREIKSAQEEIGRVGHDLVT